MSATVLFLRRAEKQIEDITQELAERSSNSVRDFWDAVDVKVEQLAQFPESGVMWADDVRRLVLRRAPYSLFSVFDAARNTVTIIACYHDRSDPTSWRF